MGLYQRIRQSTTDVRTISINLDVPQYAVQKLKEKLFFTTEKPSKDVVLWWNRLVTRDYNINDEGTLLCELEQLY